VVALALAGAGYILVYRPLQLRWGATQEEVQRAMPGDEVQSKPVFNATRAITIRAKAEQAWPWIVQIGYRRAGWYGYDWIDNDGIRSSGEESIFGLPRLSQTSILFLQVRAAPTAWPSASTR
jgi:hypothetical protein